MAEATIETIKNGPYIVKGEFELRDAEGNVYPAEKRMALCRCGASTTKPFCDGTHSKIGFQAAEKAVPESAEDQRVNGGWISLRLEAKPRATGNRVRSAHSLATRRRAGGRGA